MKIEKADASLDLHLDIMIYSHSSKSSDDDEQLRTDGAPRKVETKGGSSAALPLPLLIHPSIRLPGPFLYPLSPRPQITPIAQQGSNSCAIIII